MADRSTIITNLRLILRRMNRMAEVVAAHHQALADCRKEAAILQRRWRQAMGELDRLNDVGS